MDTAHPHFAGLSESCARIRETTNSSLLNPSVYGLASLVGSSPQTSILAAAALRPKHLLLLSTDGASGSVSTIREWLALSDLGWTAPVVSVAVCDPLDSNNFLDAVTAWSRPLEGDSTARNRIVLDATGGKKSMSVAAGMIAMVRGIEIVYIDSEFDLAARTRRPGSEKIVLIPRVTNL